jgi:DUF1009 family protein
MADRKMYDGPRSALLCGNGRYALALYSELVLRREWSAVHLLPKTEKTILDDRFLGYEGIYSPRATIRLLQEHKVERVVLAGDLGLLRFDQTLFRQALMKDLPGGVSFLARVAQRQVASLFAEGLVVSAVQLIADMLRQTNIEAVIASEVVPSLRPRLGPINDVAQQSLGWSEVHEIVRSAVPNINDQPRRFVRQAVVLDGTEVRAREIENTSKLLQRAKLIPGLAGKRRALVKLSPSNLAATIDAPVIGEDTISQAVEAAVDVIILDNKNGILAQPDDSIRMASRRGIALFGYSPTGR